MSFIPLPQNEIHIWLVLLDVNSRPPLVDAYRSLLCPEEQLQYSRIVFEKNQQEYLLAHTLLRTSLSSYNEVNPADWIFQRNAYGKPEIIYPAIRPSITFSLSHTNGLVGCALARNREIGLDLEDCRRDLKIVEMAEDVFSPQEARSLRDLSLKEQQQRFYKYWTLKEAYLKARGFGLSLPLDKFSFRWDNSHNIQIEIDSCLEDNPTTWQFRLLQPTAHHQAAVAVQTKGADEDLTFEVRWGIPSYL